MRAVPWTGDDRFRALCGPEGTAAEPSGQKNAPCWPAAMAGEAHPVPSRTRKLSPLAPMVLRCSPWESRTPPASKGRSHVNRPRGGPRPRARPGASFCAPAGLPPRAGADHGAPPGRPPRLGPSPSRAPAGDAPAGGPPEVLGAPPPGPAASAGPAGDGSRRFSARRPAPPPLRPRVQREHARMAGKARRPAGGGGPRRQAARLRGLRQRPAGLARSECDRRGGPPG